MRPAPLLIALCLALPACATAYSPPEDSGLVAVRPYPGANDVCQVIGENDLSIEYLDHTALLIGCPTMETGAIADRIAEGGRSMAVVGRWTLISIPQP